MRMTDKLTALGRQLLHEAVAASMAIEEATVLRAELREMTDNALRLREDLMEIADLALDLAIALRGERWAVVAALTETLAKARNSHAIDLQSYRRRYGERATLGN